MQGDVVDEVICGEVTVVQGAFAMGIIGVRQWSVFCNKGSLVGNEWQSQYYQEDFQQTGSEQDLNLLR